MATGKIVLQQSAELLLIGVGLRQRLLLLGFGLSLALLAATGLLNLLSHGGLAAAILLPVVAVMLLIGLWAAYFSLATSNDVYDKRHQCFLRYAGNLLHGKRVVLRLSLADLHGVEQDIAEENQPARFFLRTAGQPLEISDYAPSAVQAVAHFLASNQGTHHAD